MENKINNLVITIVVVTILGVLWFLNGIVIITNGEKLSDSPAHSVHAGVTFMIAFVLSLYVFGKNISNMLKKITELFGLDCLE